MGEAHKLLLQHIDVTCQIIEQDGCSSLQQVGVWQPVLVNVHACFAIPGPKRHLRLSSPFTGPVLLLLRGSRVSPAEYRRNEAQ